MRKPAVATKPWLLRWVVYLLITAFVVFPALMVITMHTHLDTLSLGESVGSIYRDIRQGFRSQSQDGSWTGGGEGDVRTGEGPEDGLAVEKRTAQERLEADLANSLLRPTGAAGVVDEERDKDEDEEEEEAEKKTRHIRAKDNENVPKYSKGAAGLKPWQARQAEEDLQEYALREQEQEWIEILPTPKKTPIKHDKRVRINNNAIKPLSRRPSPSAEESASSSSFSASNNNNNNKPGSPRALLEAQEELRKHPLFDVLVGDARPATATTAGSAGSSSAAGGAVGSIAQIGDGSGDGSGSDVFEETGCVAGSICATMRAIKQQPACAASPVFLTMASVGDELYWQLIENFVYTMVKFGHVQCSLVVCVSDSYCMKLCRDSLFPCYDYRRPTPSQAQQKQFHLSVKPSVMESIAELKLFHVPQALLHGVDTFMLDLDVGFLNDPRHMIEPFYRVPTIDIFVQQDYLFIMNRSQAGWKQWFTEPLPNIGMFLCRGNNKTHAVFAHAWRKYQAMTDPRTREQPGKDQNHVLDGMRVGRGTFGLRYAYFSNSTAALMDKIVQKWRGVELGGQPVADMFEREHTLAMHTTCYEQSTKVMGLKATNAFWNPRYYDPLRPTITKQILFLDSNQVRDEVRSMVWLAMATGRALISPNLVGSDALIETSPQYNNRAMWPGFRVTYLKRIRKPSPAPVATEALHADAKRGSAEDSSPSIFQVKQNALDVQILEPAFYWRVQRDYDDVPEPTVLTFDERTATLPAIRDAINALPGNSAHRVIIQIRVAEADRRKRGMKSEVILKESQNVENERVKTWAQSSVGELEGAYDLELQRYGMIPSVKSARKELGTDDVLQGMRTCNDVFARLRGNRTCFQICD